MRCVGGAGIPLSRRRPYISSTDMDLNLDPSTGAPGAHPVGTGVGAAAGGATGAAVGSVGGPIGTAVGAVIGAVVGGRNVRPDRRRGLLARELHARALLPRRPHLRRLRAGLRPTAAASAAWWPTSTATAVLTTLKARWPRNGTCTAAIRASTGPKPAPPRVPPGRARSAIAARCKRARPALSARAVPTRRSSRADAAKAGSGPARPAPAVRR